MPSDAAAVAPPEMSAKTREVLGRVRQMVPPMLDKFHKGASSPTFSAPSRQADGGTDNGDGQSH